MNSYFLNNKYQIIKKVAYNSTVTLKIADATLAYSSKKSNAKVLKLDSGTENSTSCCANFRYSCVVIPEIFFSMGRALVIIANQEIDATNYDFYYSY